MKVPSLFPVYDPSTKQVLDGTLVPVSSFCRKALRDSNRCFEHYESLEGKQAGYYECPFGFTTRSFAFDLQKWAFTGVVAHPRFGSSAERKRARDFPNTKTARATIDSTVEFLGELEEIRAETIQRASAVLPQAFHELRKLNGAVLQHSEREISERGESRGLLSIKSAAELMRNNFDILEALSNIDGIKALRNDSTINLFDLAYKMKRVFAERATERRMAIQVNGVRAIVWGSQKSFPIVPAVLIENAIKYGRQGSTVRADVEARAGVAMLIVENHADLPIDPETCFEKGVRFSSGVEGGSFGLFLAKEVVRCHGGDIRCEVNAGIVRMIVELPLHTVIDRPPINRTN